MRDRMITLKDPGSRRGRSKFAVGAVAERLALGMFAATHPGCLVFFGSHHHGHQTGSLVRPVTEWLLGTAATRAPEVLFTLLHLNLVRVLLGNDDVFAHTFSFHASAGTFKGTGGHNSGPTGGKQGCRRPDLVAHAQGMG